MDARRAVSTDDHPVTLTVTDDLKRNRLTVFFRLLLVIPHAIVSLLWGVIAILIVNPINWIATLIMGRSPQGLHNFLSSYVRYVNRVSAYKNLTADPFPPFGGGGTYPIDLEIPGPVEQKRLVTFFRMLLAIPAQILAAILGMLVGVLGFLSWFVALALGRVPEGMRDINAWCHKYIGQTRAYAMLLTPRYPSLGGGPKA